MKRILAALALALAAATSFGATLAPIQLLSPAGSASGQVIASTGPTTAPAWTTVTLAGIGGVLPVLNGGTGVTTAAAEVTRLSAAVTTGTLAQFSATTSAQLLGVLSDETGTGVAVFGTSPTITTPNLVGTATNNNAAAGSVGEYVTATGSAVSMTTGTAANVTSVSLTAGDWDVMGAVVWQPAGGTTMTAWNGTITTTSASLGTVPGVTVYSAGFTTTAGGFQSAVMPPQRLSLATTTTVFLVANVAFSGSTLTTSGTISARRRR